MSEPSLDEFREACRELIARLQVERGITPAQAARLAKQQIDALAAAKSRT